jgi:hypothetical protein
VTLSTFLIVATAPSPSPSPSGAEIDPERVTPGLLGLAALVFLAVATYLLWRNMNKQLKRVGFDEVAVDGPATDAAPGTDAADAGPTA